MEDNRRWLLLAAIAPIAWGSTYFVTKEFLPPAPLWGAAFRAIPAGLVLLCIARQRPHGAWWWKAAVLGTLNVGAFFVLVYAAAQLMPSSVASTIMALSPIALAVIAWPLIHQRPSALRLAGGVVGAGGVALMLLGGLSANWIGTIASITAMTMSSVGFVLAKRWNTDVEPLASTAWQLTAGGVLLLTAAIVTEGPPPSLSGAAIAGYGYMTIIATALAYTAWFTALGHLRADAVGLIGLLNPVTGVLLGVLAGGDALGLRQWIGLALVLVGITAPLLGRRPTPLRNPTFAQPNPATKRQPSFHTTND